jgi:hypothetical protein
MTISAYCLLRRTARNLAMFLAVPLTVQPQPALLGQQEGVSSVQLAQPEKADHTANEPAAGTAQTTPDDPALMSPQTSDPKQHAGSLPTAAEQQQSSGSEPVGTAAAPYEKPLGVAASRPAGVVIAPAKQRRAHSILIRVGLLVGAAAAIGTVVALSKASPSRPK